MVAVAVAVTGAAAVDDGPPNKEATKARADAPAASTTGSRNDAAAEVAAAAFVACCACACAWAWAVAVDVDVEADMAAKVSSDGAYAVNPGTARASAIAVSISCGVYELTFGANSGNGANHDKLGSATPAELAPLSNWSRISAGNNPSSIFN